MSLNHRILPILFLLLLSGCSSVRVSQDYEPGRSLHGLRTYAWQHDVQEKTGDIRIDSPLIDSRIRTAIDETLAARGYRKVPRDQADVLIAYQYAIRGRIRSDNVQTGIGVGFGSFSRHGAFGISTGSDISDYDEGLLVIDVIDPADGTTLWRGKGTRQVFTHAEPQKVTEQINETVHKILDQFPP